MLISKKWLQKYFHKELPKAEKIAELFNLHIFEVEQITKVGDDEVFDVKILPDRTCYSLNHRAVAKELAILLKTEIINKDTEDIRKSTNNSVNIEIETKDLCRRYIGRKVEDIKIGSSPKWLKDFLEAIGERSISNVVDMANFVMFDMGQPLHAFDADKVVGGISVRLAKKGEKMITLDNREIELSENNLIIADEEGPLALAGIKGGKRAEVNTNTKNLILESANFDPISIRRTSTALELKTEASKRFEANMNPEISILAMKEFSFLIKEVIPTANFGDIKDVYKERKDRKEIVLSYDLINKILGVNIDKEEIESILAKMGSVKTDAGEIIFTPDVLRGDLNIKEDLVEEVGRIYGYEKINPILPSPLKGKTPINRKYYFSEKIKDLLTGFGFDEVSLYAFVPKGFYEIEHPLADDKNFLRENLSFGINNCLTKNIQNAPLFAQNEVRIFEIGSVFGKMGERWHLSIGFRSQSKKNDGKNILAKIAETFGLVFGKDFHFSAMFDPYGFVAEIDITDIFSDVSLPYAYDFKEGDSEGVKKFESFSVYPFITRDIAVFVPQGTTELEPLKIIKEDGGGYLLRTDLFDRFEKKGAEGEMVISYAYRMVFQSMDRTLRDDEINSVIEKITAKMNKNKGWKVR